MKTLKELREFIGELEEELRETPADHYSERRTLEADLEAALSELAQRESDEE